MPEVHALPAQPILYHQGQTNDCGPFSLAIAANCFWPGRYPPADDAALQSLIGTVVTDKGYVSTSFNKDLSFSRMGSTDVLMEIHTPKGAQAAYLNPDESEIVLPHDTRFKVIGTRLDYDVPGEPPVKVIILEVINASTVICS